MPPNEHGSRPFIRALIGDSFAQTDDKLRTPSEIERQIADAAVAMGGPELLEMSCLHESEHPFGEVSERWAASAALRDLLSALRTHQPGTRMPSPAEVTDLSGVIGLHEPMLVELMSFVVAELTRVSPMEAVQYGRECLMRVATRVGTLNRPYALLVHRVANAIAATGDNDSAHGLAEEAAALGRCFWGTRSEYAKSRTIDCIRSANLVDDAASLVRNGRILRDQTEYSQTDDKPNRVLALRAECDGAVRQRQWSVAFDRMNRSRMLPSLNTSDDDLRCMFAFLRASIELIGLEAPHLPSAQQLLHVEHAVHAPLESNAGLTEQFWLTMALAEYLGRINRRAKSESMLSRARDLSDALPTGDLYRTAAIECAQLSVAIRRGDLDAAMRTAESLQATRKDPGFNSPDLLELTAIACAAASLLDGKIPTARRLLTPIARASGGSTAQTSGRGAIAVHNIALCDELNGNNAKAAERLERLLYSGRGTGSPYLDRAIAQSMIRQFASWPEKAHMARFYEGRAGTKATKLLPMIAPVFPQPYNV